MILPNQFGWVSSSKPAKLAEGLGPKRLPYVKRRSAPKKWFLRSREKTGIRHLRAYLKHLSGNVNIVYFEESSGMILKIKNARQHRMITIQSQLCMTRYALYGESFIDIQSHTYYKPHNILSKLRVK
jgi:hypothetical protein